MPKLGSSKSESAPRGGGLLNEEDHGRASCRGRDKGISWLSDRPYTGVIYEATEFRICQ
jgi:hypothetical protein